eukprot:2104484-Amphidinium_carterae.2
MNSVGLPWSTTSVKGRFRITSSAETVYTTLNAARATLVNCKGQILKQKVVLSDDNTLPKRLNPTSCDMSWKPETSDVVSSPQTRCSLLQNVGMDASSMDAWAEFAHALAGDHHDERYGSSTCVAEPLFTLKSPQSGETRRKRGRPKKHAGTSGVVIASANNGRVLAVGGVGSCAHEHDSEGAMLCSGVPSADACSALPHAAFRASAIDPTAIDESTLLVAAVSLDPQGHHLSSGIVEANNVGMSLPSLQLRKSRIAAGICLMQRLERRYLEQVASTFSKRSLLAYFDVVAYDETPMVAALALKPENSMTIEDHQQGPLVCPSRYRSEDDAGRYESVNARMVGKAKLLQTKSSYVMLMMAGHTAVVLHGETLNPIANLSRTTSEVLQETLFRLSGVTEASSSFQLLCRSAVLDQAASNVVTEGSICSRRGSNWQGMVLPCQTHIISTSFKKTFQALFAEDVTGMIQYVLSVRETGKWALWRKCLIEEMRSRPVVVRTIALSEDAVLHKELLLDVIFARQRASLKKIVLLKSTFNGDWRNIEALEYVTADRHSISLVNLRSQMESILLDTLGSSQPVLFPRHRWTGTEDSLSALCALFAVHGLMKPTFCRFVSSLKTSAVKSLDQCSSSMTAGAAAGVLESAQLDVEMSMVEAGLQAQIAGVEGASSANNAVDGATYSKLCAKNRQKTLDWLDTAPYHRLLLMLLVCVPLTDLLHEQLRTSSEDWESEQRALLASAMLDGVCSFSSRTYQLLLAAKGLLEQKFFDALSKLLHSTVWNVFPAECTNNAFRGMGCRLLMRAGAVIHELLADPHCKYPVKLFDLVHPTTTVAAETMASEPDC